MKKIARIVLSISLDKEFDYSFSRDLPLKKGMRVLVDFRGRKRVGLVSKLLEVSAVKKTKEVISLLDNRPLLGESQFSFAKKLSRFYPYPLGDFLFMMLPAYLKKAHQINFANLPSPSRGANSFFQQFIKSREFLDRYQCWKELIPQKLKAGSVVVCFPQLAYLLKAKQLMEKDFPLPIKVLHSQLPEGEFFRQWQSSRSNSLIVGTRMALFHYPADLRLIVIEEEDSPYYFQQEKPFYDLRQVALLLAEIMHVDLILAGSQPTLSTYKYIRDQKMKLSEIKPESKKISLIDLGGFSRKKVIGPVLIELLERVVKLNKQAVILWNKRGFAQALSCSACGYIYKCSHCSGFLQFSLSNQKARCPHCHRQIALPRLCHHCQKGYLKSSGLGIEKLGSLLKTVFPQIKIDDWQNRSPDSGIILSTVEILSSLYDREIFDSGFMLDTDSLLSRMDYQATFEVFLYINKLAGFFRDALYVFTHNRRYYLFDYLNRDWQEFYEKEISLRRKLGLPPFKLLAKITLRSKDEKVLLKQAEDLYNKLRLVFKEVYGPFQEYPFKLRDKFRYSLVIKTGCTLRKRALIKEIIAQLRSLKLQFAAELH